MCRNIKRLRRDDPPVTRSEFEEAARNLVRKLSGFREPSHENHDVFEKAVAEITAESQDLLRRIHVRKHQKTALS